MRSSMRLSVSRVYTCTSVYIALQCPIAISVYTLFLSALYEAKHLFCLRVSPSVPMLDGVILSTRSCTLMVARCVARRPQRSGVAGDPSRPALVQKGRTRTWSRRPCRPRLSQRALTLSIKISNASLFLFFCCHLVQSCTWNVHLGRRGRVRRKQPRPTLVSRPVAGDPPANGPSQCSPRATTLGSIVNTEGDGS